MKTKLTQPFNFSDVPASMALCFCEECPRHDDCLRYLAGQYAPVSLTFGPAVYPAACQSGDCPHFKEVRVIQGMYGFSKLFSEVRHQDYRRLRDEVKAYLGGHSNYYRYHRGERMLTPEQQQAIKAMFQARGYDHSLTFDGYREQIDFA